MGLIERDYYEKLKACLRKKGNMTFISLRLAHRVNDK
jgi:hypothetical protein